MASGLTSAVGTYLDCGFGRSYSLHITCQGPSCAALASFPSLSCTHSSALTSECDNGIVCGNTPVTTESTNFESNFTIQQPPMGITVMTNQNLDVGGQAISLNGTSDGNVTYTYQAVTVSNNGTSISGTPVSTGARTTTSSASSKRPFCPPWFLLFVVIMSMFVAQVPAQSVSWNDVLRDVPTDNVAFITSLEPQLCDGSVPVIDAVICGARQQVLGIADIARLCLQVLGQAHQPAAATADPVSAMLFALGNTIACNKIANAMLSGTTDQQVGRDLCSAVIPSSACVTSIVTTVVTTHGSTMTISSFISVSSPSAGSTTTGTSGALPSSGSFIAPATAATTANSETSSGGASTQSEASIPPGITLSAPPPAPNNASALAIKHRRNGIICDDPHI